MEKLQSYKLDDVVKKIQEAEKHDVSYVQVVLFNNQDRQTLARLPSVPEHPPKPQGRIVPDHLLSVIEQAQDLQLDPSFDRMRNDHLQKLSELVKQRNAFGMQKYGQPLYSED